MKKLLFLSIGLIVILCGCGDTSEEEAMIYQGESGVNYEGTYATVSYTIVGDDITEASFDNITSDGESEYALAEEAQTTGETYLSDPTEGDFNDQADAVSSYLVENDSFPSLDDEGYADGTDTFSGATIALDGFEEAYLGAQVVK